MQEKTKTQIQKFKNGDKKAFDQIVIEHKDWVINMILSMVHNRQDAEDISQDVFVSVYFALDKFKGLSSFNTWLYRIVINKINGHYRKLKLRNTFNLELSKVEHLHFSDIDEESMLREFDKEELYKAVVSLKSRQRSVVLLRIYQGHSFREIGKLLNITENSSKVSFHQAKKNLERKLKNG